MAHIKTATYLQKSLLDQVEALARELKVSRCRLFVLAAEDFVRRHQNRKLVERIDQAQADQPDTADQKRLKKMRRQRRRLVEGEW